MREYDSCRQGSNAWPLLEQLLRANAAKALKRVCFITYDVALLTVGIASKKLEVLNRCAYISMPDGRPGRPNAQNVIVPNETRLYCKFNQDGGLSRGDQPSLSCNTACRY